MRALIRTLLRLLLKPLLGPRASIAWQRRVIGASAALAPRARGVVRSGVQWGGVRGETHVPAGAPAEVALLYLHGGGYCIGTPASYRGLTSALAAASGLAVHVPDYRLAPEQPCPAALEDARAVYAGLARQSRAVVLAGDSAGGGLALALAQALRAGGERAPAALLLISPWVDLGCSSATFAERAARDPLLSPGGLRRWAACYAGARGVSDPACSPLHGEAGGLPPALIQVGSEEVLLDDSRRLHARIEAAGGRATLRVFEGLWHDFQLHAGLLADADAAIAELGAFARAHAPT
jgi:monoterpene epsilon-lactone hydrolase